MDWGALVALVVPVVFIVTVGGVVLFRPLVKRLGTLLDAMAREKSRSSLEDLRRLQDVVEAMNQRMALLEERQDFTERLIDRGTSGEGGLRLEEPKG